MALSTVKKAEKKAKAPTKAPKEKAPKEAKGKTKVAGAGGKEKKPPPKTASEWMERVNADRRFVGKSQIKSAADVKTPYSLRRPSGILSLDLALGGGLHAGSIAEVQGIKSAGKTFLAYTFAARQQEIYGEDVNILIYAVEIRPDKGFARMAGFCIAYSEEEIAELNAMRIDSGLSPFTEEDKADLRKQIGNVIVITADTAETGLGIVEDALRKFGKFHFVIIESLGAFLTKEGEEHEVGDKLFAGATIAVTSFVNKVFPLFMMDRADGSMLETTILGINQARSKMAASKFERAERAAMGAHAWQHAQLVNIIVEKGAKLRDGEKGPVIGKAVNFTLEKGKVGTHDGKSGTYNYYHLPKMDPVFWRDLETNWYGGIDLYTDTVEVAKAQGLLDVKGSWLSYKLNGKEYRAQSVEKFADLIGKKPEISTSIRNEVFRKNGILVRNK